MNSKPFYSFPADIIRVVAIFAVVVIHTTNAIYTRPDFFGGTTWWIAIILDSLARISIPLFIMLSGFLLLRKDETLEQSLKRITSRIALPFVFWSLFYIWLGTGTPDLTRINQDVFFKMFSGDVYHLYFLLIMVGLYLIAPLLTSYMQRVFSSSQDFFMKCLLILGVSEVVLQFIFQACAWENIFTRFLPYTGLFVAGYLLSNKETLPKKKLLIGYTTGLLCTLGFNYLHYSLLARNIIFFDTPGCLSHYTDHYLSINVVLMSLCAFLLLLKLQYKKLQEHTQVNNLIRSLAKASFGMYLIHPVVARILEIQFHLAVDFSPLPILLIIFLKLFLTLFLSYLITTLALKTPLVKYIFGGR